MIFTVIENFSEAVDPEDRKLRLRMIHGRPKEEAVDRKQRIARLRKVAAYGRHQGNISKAKKAQADKADARWWKHATAGGHVQVHHLDPKKDKSKDTAKKIADFAKGKNKKWVDPVARDKHAKKRKSASNATQQFDRDSREASIKRDRARDLVQAYGHPKAKGRWQAKQSIRIDKGFRGAVGDKSTRDHKRDHYFGVHDKYQKKHPSTQPLRKTRVSRIKDRAATIRKKAHKAWNVHDPKSFSREDKYFQKSDRYYKAAKRWEAVDPEERNLRLNKVQKKLHTLISASAMAKKAGSSKHKAVFAKKMRAWNILQGYRPWGPGGRKKSGKAGSRMWRRTQIARGGV